MPNNFSLKTTPKCILSYKYCLILLRKIITGFVTLITGEPVDQVENKKICMPQIYLATHNRKPFVDICYGLREKRLRRVVLVKKKLPYQKSWGNTEEKVGRRQPDILKF